MSSSLAVEIICSYRPIVSRLDGQFQNGLTVMKTALISDSNMEECVKYFSLVRVDFTADTLFTNPSGVVKNTSLALEHFLKSSFVQSHSHLFVGTKDDLTAFNTCLRSSFGNYETKVNKELKYESSTPVNSEIESLTQQCKTLSLKVEELEKKKQQESLPGCIPYFKPFIAVQQPSSSSCFHIFGQPVLAISPFGWTSVIKCIKCSAILR